MLAGLSSVLASLTMHPTTSIDIRLVSNVAYLNQIPANKGILDSWLHGGGQQPTNVEALKARNNSPVTLCRAVLQPCSLAIRCIGDISICLHAQGINESAGCLEICSAASDSDSHCHCGQTHHRLHVKRVMLACMLQTLCKGIAMSFGSFKSVRWLRSTDS